MKQFHKYYRNNKPQTITHKPLAMETYPSICIPRATMITSREVKTILETFFGESTIDRVDIVYCRETPDTCKIFVHMNYWPKNEKVTMLRNRLLEGNCINIVYKKYLFWKCFKSRLPKPESKQRVKHS